MSHFRPTPPVENKVRRSNQHKPTRMSFLAGSSPSNLMYSLAPDLELWPYLFFYWSLGFGDKRIAEHCMDHFSSHRYQLGYVYF